MAIEPTSTAAPASSVADVDMGEVMRRVASELADVASLAQTLQVTLSPFLGRASHAAAAAQELDQITQRVDGLTTFIVALGHRCPNSWQIAPAEAAAALPLHNQKIRLGSPPSSIDECEPAGILELF